MAEITTPIVTITLVLAAVFVPVAFIPGLTGRLYNQFALTIVFSFLFSALNSLTFSPAMARLFLKAKTHHGESKFFFFRWFNRGMKWLENSYDSFLEYTAHHWWLIVIPSLALLALTGVDALRAAQVVHPGGRPGLPHRHGPDPGRHHPGADLAGHGSGRADRPEAGGRGRHDPVRRAESDHAGEPGQQRRRSTWCSSTGRSARRPSCGPGPWWRSSRRSSRDEITEALALVFPPPPIQGLGTTGGFEFLIEDREGTGRAGAGRRRRPVHGRGRASGPSCPDSSPRSRSACPSSASTSIAVKARMLDVPVSDGLRDAPGVPRRLLRQRLQPLRQDLAGLRPVRGRPPAGAERHPRRSRS